MNKLLDQAGKNMAIMTERDIVDVTTDYPEVPPIAPMWDLLLIQPLHKDRARFMRMPSGVITTGEANTSQPVWGRVIDKGEGLMNGDGTFTPVPIEVGEEILYHLHECEEKDEDGHRYHMLRAKSVIGKRRT